MPWVRFDDRFPSHRKIRLLSDAAFRLYVSAICWSAENLTDGVIKATELRLVSDVRAARKRAQELVEAGLWEELPGTGWRIHDYHDYQPTAEQVHAERAAKTARQRRWRAKQRAGRPDPTPPSGRPDVDASTDASRDASRDGAGDAAPRARVPDPSRPTTGTGSRESDRSSGRARETLSLTPAADWAPSDADLAWARDRGHTDRLGPGGIRHATAKWAARRAAHPDRTPEQWSADWRQWIVREHPDPTPAPPPLRLVAGGGADEPAPVRSTVEQYVAHLRAALDDEEVTSR